MGVASINLRPKPRVLRQFGYAAVIGFGLVGAMAWFQFGLFGAGLGSWRVGVAATMATLGALSLVFSLVCPRANLPLFIVLSVVAFPIGFALSYVVLGLLYYGVLTPAGFVLRLLGKDPMARRFETASRTYWVDAQKPRPESSYFRQY